MRTATCRSALVGGLVAAGSVAAAELYIDDSDPKVLPNGSMLVSDGHGGGLFGIGYEGDWESV